MGRLDLLRRRVLIRVVLSAEPGVGRIGDALETAVFEVGAGYLAVAELCQWKYLKAGAGHSSEVEVERKQKQLHKKKQIGNGRHGVMESRSEGDMPDNKTSHPIVHHTKEMRESHLTMRITTCIIHPVG